MIKHSWKRLLSMLLAVCMVVSMLPVSALASADGDSSTQDWSLTKEGNVWYLDILNGHITEDEVYEALLSQSTVYGTPNPAVATTTNNEIGYTWRKWSPSSGTTTGSGVAVHQTTSEGGYQIGDSLYARDGGSFIELANNTGYAVKYATTTTVNAADDDAAKWTVQAAAGLATVTSYSGTVKNYSYASQAEGVSFTVRYYYMAQLASFTGPADEDKPAMFYRDPCITGEDAEGRFKVYHGETVTVYAQKVDGYTRTVTNSNGEILGTLPADADSMQITVDSIEDAQLTVTYVKKPAMEVSVNKTGNGTVTGNTGDVVIDTALTYTIDPDDGWYVNTITVNGEKQNLDATKFSGNTYTFNWTVTNVESGEYAGKNQIYVTFTQKALVQNPVDSDNEIKVGYNPTKSTAAQVKGGGYVVGTTTLEENIFNAVVNTDASSKEALPHGLAWNSEGVTIQYNPWLDKQYGTDGYDSNALAIGADAPADTDGLGDNHTYYNFGERAFSNGSFVGCEEQVVITWAGDAQYPAVSITAIITLVDGRPEAFAVDNSGYEAQTAADVSSDDAIIAAAKAYLTNFKGGLTADSTLVSYQVTTYPTLTSGAEGPAVVTVTVADNTSADYKPTTKTVNVKVFSNAQPAQINTSINSGSISLYNNKTGDAITDGRLNEGTVKFVVTPTAGYYVESVTVTYKDAENNDVAVTVTPVGYDNAVYTGTFPVLDDCVYTVTVVTKQRTVTVNDVNVPNVEDNASYHDIDMNMAYAVSKQPSIDVEKQIIDTVIKDVPTGANKYDATIKFYSAGFDLQKWFTTEEAEELSDRDSLFGGMNELAAAMKLPAGWYGLDEQVVIKFDYWGTVTVDFKVTYGDLLFGDGDDDGDFEECTEKVIITYPATGHGQYQAVATDEQTVIINDTRPLITYTDGVAGSEIFADQSARVDHEGTDKTNPAFAGAIPTYTDGAGKAQYGYTDSTSGITYRLLGWKDSKGNEYKLADYADLAALNGVIDALAVTADGDNTYTAQWVAVYTVTFMKADGVALETDYNVALGSTPSFGGTNPTLDADKQYSYTFAGWAVYANDGKYYAVGGATVDLATYEVTGNVTFIPVFTWSTNSYTATFVSADGVTLDTDTVEYGKAPSYSGATPTKAPDKQYSYEFKGWAVYSGSGDYFVLNGAIETLASYEVKGNVTFIPVFTTTTQTYTVTFMNGTEKLAEYTVEYGKAPSYSGATPTKVDPNGQISYGFLGWNTDSSADTALILNEQTVTDKVTYYAIFTEAAIHTVTIVYNNGSSNGEAKVVDGNSITDLTDPAKTYHSFKGWTVDGGTTLYTTEQIKAMTITGDMTITAQWTLVALTAETALSELVAESLGKVIVECANAEMEHDAAEYTLTEDYITVVSSDDNTTATVTINTAYYAGLYMADYVGGDHAVVTDGTVTTITLVYTEANGWTVSGNVTSIVVNTQCASVYTVTYTDGKNGAIFANEVNPNLVSGTATPELKASLVKEDGLAFAGWTPTRSATVTASVTYTAQWKADTNNNEVPDEDETITVVITGNGSGTVTINGTTVKNGDELVYKSNEAATIIATPAAGGTGYGYYVDGITGANVTGTVTINGNYAKTVYTARMDAGKGNVTLTITFGKLTVEAQNNTVYVNGWTGDYGLDYSKRLAGYKDGLTTGNFLKSAPSVEGSSVVQMETRTGWKNVSELNSTTHAGYLDVPATKSVRIVWTPSDTAKYPSITSATATATIEEARPTAEVDPSALGEVTDVNTDADIVDAIEKAVKASYATTNSINITGMVEVSGTNHSAAQDGAAYEVSYTVTIPSTENYVGTTYSGKVSVTGKVHNSVITIVNVTGCTISVNAGDLNDVEPGTYTITVTPNTDKPYYVDTITVNGETVSVSWANNVGTASFTTSNGDSASNTYTVSATVGVRSITVNETIAKVEYDPATDTIDTIKGAVYSAIVSGSVPGGIDVEDCTVTLADEDGTLDVKENNSFTVTWAATEKYPAVSVTASVYLSDQRQQAVINISDASIGTVDLDSSEDAAITDAALKAKILAAISGVSVTVGASDLVYNVTNITDRPLQGGYVDYIVTIDCPENGKYLAADQKTVIVKVSANVLDSKVTVTTDGAGVTYTAGETNGTLASGSYAAGDYSIVIAPVGSGVYIDTVTVNGTVINADQTTENFSWTQTFTSAGLAMGQQAEYTIVVNQETGTITANGDKEIEVNGFNADTIFAGITKLSVLAAILGDEAVEAESFNIDDYTVKMKVTALGVWLDIWALGSSSEYGEDAIKAAIDINQSETFQVTYNKSGDKYTAIVGEYSVSLKDSRPFANATHNDKTYNASELNAALLNDIKLDLTTDTGITSIDWDSNTVPETLVEGETYQIGVVVTLNKSEEYQANTVTVTVTVNVPVIKASISIPESAVMTYNTSMTDAKLNEMVIAALNGTDGNGIVYIPTSLKDVETTVWYLARANGTVPVSIKYSGMGGLINIDETINVPVTDLWLNIGEAYPDVGKQPSQSELDVLAEDLITNYGVELLDMTQEQLLNIFMLEIENYPEIKKYITYVGTHKFGYNSETDENGMVLETVKLTQKDTGSGSVESNRSVLTLNDERKETYIVLNSGVSLVYGFTKEQLLDALAPQVYAKTESGDVLVSTDVTLITSIDGMSVTESGEITVRYEGDSENQYCSATTTIAITKAPVTVTVDNQIIKHGDPYNALPVTTNPADVDTIQFIVGLDISNVNVDTSEGVSLGAIKGIVSDVQLLLPEELQALLNQMDEIINSTTGLDVSFADGASMKLSELQASLNAFGKLFEGTQYEEMVKVLTNMVGSLPTDTLDARITIGGELPTNVGVYLIGAVTADSNYETAFGVGVLAIYPDGIKAELDWKMDDDNYIITRSLLTSGVFDASAVAISVGEGGTIEEATAQAFELFLGLDIDGNITIESDQTLLNVGAYLEVAMIVNWGNEMYYSAPIARPIVVVAETLDVEFIDANGDINNERKFVFDNDIQDGMENILVTYKQDGNGYAAGDKVADELYQVKYYYVGVQTNGMPYASTTAPLHAGAYTVTAIVTIRNDEGITHAGQGIGVLAIEPAQSDVYVDNAAIKFDDADHKVNVLVHASSAASTAEKPLTPDTTIISAGVAIDRTSSASGLEAIEGVVNVDLPVWLDELFAKYGILEAAYTETGITVSVFESYLDTIRDTLTELGIDTTSFDEVVAIIDQLPDTTTLTFHSDKAYSNVGAYLVLAVVTDSDHYPSVGAGLMLIYPDATKVELKFEEDWNDNNIFTWQALQTLNLDAQAYDLDTGNYDAAADEFVTNVYLGFTDDGKVLLTKDKSVLDNGVYTQVAFLLDLGTTMYYAEPISRVFMIVPNPVTITFVDKTGADNADRVFTFNNGEQGMDVIVTQNGVELANTLKDNYDNLTITYTGVQTNLETYNSTTPPTHAGTYVVTAHYATRDEQGRVVNLGAEVGAMVILPADSDITVNSAAIPYDGLAHSINAMVSASSAASTAEKPLTPDTTIITASVNTNGSFSEDLLDAIEGSINIDLPGWADKVLAEYENVADGITVKGMISALDTVVAELTELNIETEVFTELRSVLEQLPGELTVTFNSNVEKTAVGVYLVIGLVTDSDHLPAMDVGYLVIYPEVIEVELEFNNIDSNGIFTNSLVEKFDFNATAYTVSDGEVNAAATKQIQHIFFGVDEEGNIVLKAGVDAAKQLPYGVYTQLSFIAQIDSVMYLAEPIVRPIIRVRDTVNVDFEDVETSYNGKAQGIGEVSITGLNGESIDVNAEALTVYYAGISTNGQPYWSETAPVHAGVYTVFAIYLDGENMGAHAGSLVITPAEAAIDVPSQAVKYGTEYDITVTVTPVDETIDPTDAKYLLITAGTDTTVSGGKLSLSSINTINIDFPEAVDAVLDALNISDGITVGDFTGLAENIQAALDLIGYENEYLTQAMDLLKQMDEGVTVSFTDNYEPENVGVYFLIATVFDPDYMPAVDTGVLVIYPNGELVDIEFTTPIPGELNIMPYNTVVDFDFSAYTDNAETESMLNNVIFGLTTDGELFVSDGNAEGNPTELGVYTQVAYLDVDLNLADGNTIYVAIPEFRLFSVVPCDYDVIFVVDPDAQPLDKNEYRQFTYTGEPIEMPAVIVDAQGNKVEGLEPTVWYIGLDTTLDATWSTQAPTEAGIYNTVAYYFDEAANIYVMATGVMVIRKAASEFTLYDNIVIYDGTEKFTTMLDVMHNPNNADAVYVIIDRDENVANILLEDDLSAIVEAINDVLSEAGKQLPTSAYVDVTDFKAAVAEVLADAESLSEKLPESISETVDEVLELMNEALDKLPNDGTVAINSDKPVHVGTYEVYAVSYSANYTPAASAAELVIEPIKLVIEAEDKTKTYGDADPELTYVVKADGIVKDVDDIPGLTVTISRAEGEEAGEYTITVTAQCSDSNYEIVAVTNGTLTIKELPKAPEITIADDGTVTITTDEEGATIYYSVNGGEPVEYTGSFTVEHGDEVTAYVVMDGVSSEESNKTAELKTGYTISGEVTSWNGNNKVVIELYAAGTAGNDDAEVLYSVEIAPDNKVGQTTQSFELEGVAAGTYDLVVKKVAHLDYTIRGVVVEGNLDLTENSDTRISHINMIVGDVNGDDVVDGIDLSLVWSSENYNKAEADANNKLTDINGDHVIDGIDLSIVWSSDNYNKGISNCDVPYTA